MRLIIDIESYSEANLQKTGVYRYAEDASFELLLFGVSIDGGAVKVYDVKHGEEIPEEILTALQDSTVIKSSFNAMFERVCLSRYLWDLGRLPHGQYLDPRGWHCDMVWAGYMGFPMSLKSAGAALGLDEQKMEEGGELITYFCKPYRATARNGYGHRNLPQHAPEKWELFKAYNQRDVEVEMAIEEKLKAHPVPAQIWEEYVLDQEINDRGIQIDTEMAMKAIELDEQSAYHIREEMQRITRLENPQSVIQLQKWLKANGVELESLGKKELAKELDGIEEPMRTVLLLRQQLAKSAVKKYKAMESAVCRDGRLRGMFRFYGANRSGRFSSAITQLQNLFRNSLPDLEEARSLVKAGNYDAVTMLYESVPEVLAQCVRTAFIPAEGMKFIVADFSSIEARVLAWLAGEEWKMEAFREGKDIYCETASRMFHVKVEKHGENAEYRQRGKQAELSCIAEGQLVLTDRGLIPIERVRTDMRVWDGEEWVKHDGVVYRGEREVIEYEGLTATPDHLVYVEGESRPIRFENASALGAYLVQAGNGREAVRLGEDNQSRKAVESKNELLLCFNAMSRLRFNPVANIKQPESRQVERLSELYPSATDSHVAGETISLSQEEVREPERCRLQELWRKRDKVRFSECDSRRTLLDSGVRIAGEKFGTGSSGQQRGLCSREYSFCDEERELCEQTNNGIESIRTVLLAIHGNSSEEQVITGIKPKRDYRKCAKSSIGKEKELAGNSRTSKVYDIRNAGRHHRFTVSGKLVHNCGYGGGIGALKAMGALEAGMKEEELQPLVEAWRRANPRIVKLWADVEAAAKTAVKEKTTAKTHGLVFTYRGGMLYIRLPSGRNLSYVKPRMGENRYGGEGLTYMGNDFARHWARVATFGGKLVENLTQGISRDLLCHALEQLRDMRIVGHVHDEIIIESPMNTSVEEVCEKMSRVPSWAEGLNLRADGYECKYYRKD